jgi:hypothetical protein
MNKTLIFFCISCCLVIFSIIVICTGPIITKDLGSTNWRNQNCQRFSDRHKDVDEKNRVTGDLKDELLKYLKEGQHLCEREKAMYGLEYASLIFDLFFGVLCSLLSLLHYFGKGNYFEKVTGIIGLACGIIGFILTLIYIIYSGYIFTNDGPGKDYDGYFSSVPASSSSISHRSGGVIKLDKERAFAEWDGSKYKCLYYDANNEDSFYAKYNDLGKKQYNYHKDFEYPDSSSEFSKSACKLSSPLAECQNPRTSKVSNCNKLYYNGNGNNGAIYYKYMYDKWVTSIIFGCFIIVLNLGLAGFGFLLFSQTEGSSGHVAVK